MIPGLLGMPDQPDYMEATDAFQFNMAKITAQHWVDGDDDERAMIDQNLDRARKRMERDFKDDHHWMVFGESRF